MRAGVTSNSPRIDRLDTAPPADFPTPKKTYNQFSGSIPQARRAVILQPGVQAHSDGPEPRVTAPINHPAPSGATHSTLPPMPPLTGSVRFGFLLTLHPAHPHFLCPFSRSSRLNLSPCTGVYPNASASALRRKLNRRATFAGLYRLHFGHNLFHASLTS